MRVVPPALARFWIFVSVRWLRAWASSLRPVYLLERGVAHLRDGHRSFRHGSLLSASSHRATYEVRVLQDEGEIDNRVIIVRYQCSSCNDIRSYGTGLVSVASTSRCEGIGPLSVAYLSRCDTVTHAT